MADSPWTDPAELNKGNRNMAKSKLSGKDETTKYGKTASGGSLGNIPLQNNKSMDTFDSSFKASKGLKGLPKPQ